MPDILKITAKCAGGMDYLVSQRNEWFSKKMWKTTQPSTHEQRAAVGRATAYFSVCASVLAYLWFYQYAL